MISNNWERKIGRESYAILDKKNSYIHILQIVRKFKP